MTDQQESLEQLPPLNPPQTSPVEPHHPKWMIILLLFVFPPLAWYFMYKEKKYHHWFAILLIFFGATYALLFGSFIFLVIQRLSALYKEIGSQPTINPYLIPSIFMIYGIAQLSFGIYLKMRLKSINTPKMLLLIAIILLVLNQLFIMGLGVSTTILSTILPIYNATSQF